MLAKEYFYILKSKKGSIVKMAKNYSKTLKYSLILNKIMAFWDSYWEIMKTSNNLFPGNSFINLKEFEKQ